MVTVGKEDAEHEKACSWGIYTRHTGRSPGSHERSWPGQESGVIFSRFLKQKLHVNAVTDTVGRFMRWRYLNAIQCTRTLNARTDGPGKRLNASTDWNGGSSCCLRVRRTLRGGDS